MITTYQTVQAFNKGAQILLGQQQSYIRFMDYSARMERVKRSGMSFRARLAAMQAVSQTTVINRFWN